LTACPPAFSLTPMFIGHYAVGLAAKRVQPSVSLGVLLAASQLVDLLWPIFVLAGFERVEIAPGNTAFTPLAFPHYPWSHSLVMCVAWAGAFGALVFARKRSWRQACVVAALVVSHWVLDFLSHGPDMPLWPGGPRFGLGLWQSVPATLLVEISMFAAGIALYVRGTRARDRLGTWSLVGLLGLLSAAYVGNALGPLPPSSRAVAVSALALWIVPPWGVWIDRHRVAA